MPAHKELVAVQITTLGASGLIRTSAKNLINRAREANRISHWHEGAVPW